MTERDEPPLRLASANENAPTREQKIATLAFQYALAHLFANLLRVARSRSGMDGDPQALFKQLTELQGATLEFQKAFGHDPPSEAIRDALDYWTPRYEQLTQRAQERDTNFSYVINRDAAECSIIDGASQIIASRLLGQSTQESHGSYELHEGVRSLNRAEECERQRLSNLKPGEASAKRLKFLEWLKRPSKKRSRKVNEPEN